jgi:hypothetical protein
MPLKGTDSYRDGAFADLCTAALSAGIGRILADNQSALGPTQVPAGKGGSLAANPSSMPCKRRRQKTLEALAARLEVLSRSNPALMIFEERLTLCDTRRTQRKLGRCGCGSERDEAAARCRKWKPQLTKIRLCLPRSQCKLRQRLWLPPARMRIDRRMFKGSCAGAATLPAQ